MPTAQLTCAVIERVVNSILKLDPGSSDRLEPLYGKAIRIQLTELSFPLVFTFAENVVLMSHHEPVCCDIQGAIPDLLELRDSSQISHLIQQHKVKLDGDLQTAQRFASVLEKLDIDWPEQLAKYSGDVIAHQFSNWVISAKNKLKQQVRAKSEIARDALVIEKALLVSNTQMSEYRQQVEQLRADTARLEARFEQLVRNVT